MEKNWRKSCLENRTKLSRRMIHDLKWPHDDEFQSSTIRHTLGFRMPLMTAHGAWRTSWTPKILQKFWERSATQVPRVLWLSVRTFLANLDPNPAVSPMGISLECHPCRSFSFVSSSRRSEPGHPDAISVSHGWVFSSHVPKSREHFPKLQWKGTFEFLTESFFFLETNLRYWPQLANHAGKTHLFYDPAPNHLKNTRTAYFVPIFSFSRMGRWM